MPDFQLVLATSADLVPDDDGGPYSVELHASSDRILQAVERLGEVWEVAVGRLTELASSTRNAVTDSPFELEYVEFNLGIEAGLSVGLVTKGEASVALRFARKGRTTDE